MSVEPQQVRLRRLQLPQRLLLLRLVFGDARRFLENRAPILRPRREDHVDLPLLHDRVGRAADARIHEELVDVLQPARRLVQQILRAAIAENAARDRHLMPVEPELLLAFGKGHRNLRHADRRARIGAGENHVRHFAAAQRLGRLLAEHPAHRVEHVGFAAAVRPDHAGHAAVEVHHRLRREGLEAEEFEGFEIHGPESAAPQTSRKLYLEWSRFFAPTLSCGFSGFGGKRKASPFPRTPPLSEWR